ncbi:hypothetical protein B0H19DRAFT_1140751 [Mycena capillaripes]|nr:hypothetical protein B0H19DRAFT_1140751 [Mycena capillaripes]
MYDAVHERDDGHSTLDDAEGNIEGNQERSLGLNGHIRCSRCGIAARVRNLKAHTQ